MSGLFPREKYFALTDTTIAKSVSKIYSRFVPIENYYESYDRAF